MALTPLKILLGLAALLMTVEASNADVMGEAKESLTFTATPPPNVNDLEIHFSNSEPITLGGTAKGPFQNGGASIGGTSIPADPKTGIARFFNPPNSSIPQ